MSIDYSRYIFKVNINKNRERIGEHIYFNTELNIQDKDGYFLLYRNGLFIRSFHVSEQVFYRVSETGKFTLQLKYVNSKQESIDISQKIIFSNESGVDSDLFECIGYNKNYADYYIAGISGDDNNDGLTPETAFQSLKKALSMPQDYDYMMYGLCDVYTPAQDLTISDDCMIYGLGQYDYVKGYFNQYSGNFIAAGCSFKIIHDNILELKDLIIDCVPYKKGEEIIDFMMDYTVETGYYHNQNRDYSPLLLTSYVGTCADDNGLDLSYYLDPFKGDDSNTGLTPEQAFRTLDKCICLNDKGKIINLLNNINAAGEEHFIREHTIINGNNQEVKEAYFELYEDVILELNNIKLVNENNKIIYDYEGMNKIKSHNQLGLKTYIDGTLSYLEEIEYFVDNKNGDDGNKGTSPYKPFRTLKKALDKAGQKMTISIISEEIKEDTPRRYQVHNNTLIRGLGVFNKDTGEYDRTKINKVINTIFEVDAEKTLTLAELQLLNIKDEIVQNFIKNEGIFHNMNIDKSTIEINGVDIDITHAKIKPILTIITKDILEGEDELIEITLMEKDKKGITAPVIVSVAQQKHTVNIIDGKGSLTLKELPVGSYLVEAVFEGDDVYDMASCYGSFHVESNDFDYYVDSVHGDDKNRGISPHEAYKTLDKALSNNKDKRIALINEKT